MGQGIASVWTASGRGGLKIAKNAFHIAGLLNTALGSGDSANPFQNLGLGERMIFEPLNETTFTPTKDRIKEIFADFEEQELSSLQKRPDNLLVITTTEGEAAMLVHAIDLETSDNFTLSVIGRQGGFSVGVTG